MICLADFPSKKTVQKLHFNQHVDCKKKVKKRALFFF